MTIPEQIKAKRKQLKESQTVFGRRFGTTRISVWRWETGKREAPYKVLEFVLKEEK